MLGKFAIDNCTRLVVDDNPLIFTILKHDIYDSMNHALLGTKQKGQLGEYWTSGGAGALYPSEDHALPVEFDQVADILQRVAQLRRLGKTLLPGDRLNQLVVKIGIDAEISETQYFMRNQPD